jgi:hypothetical protein
MGASGAKAQVAIVDEVTIRDAEIWVVRNSIQACPVVPALETEPCCVMRWGVARMESLWCVSTKHGAPSGVDASHVAGMAGCSVACLVAFSCAPCYPPLDCAAPVESRACVHFTADPLNFFIVSLHFSMPSTRLEQERNTMHTDPSETTWLARTNHRLEGLFLELESLPCCT